MRIKKLHKRVSIFLAIVILNAGCLLRGVGDAEDEEAKKANFFVVVNVLREGMKRDEEKWSQETLNQIKHALGLSASDNLLTSENFRPFHFLMRLDSNYLCDSHHCEILADILKLLVELKHPLLDLNECDDIGDTLVHFVIRHGCWQIFTILGSYPEINFQQVNRSHQTPLMYAALKVLISDLNWQASPNKISRDVALTKKAEAQAIFRALLLHGAFDNLHDKTINDAVQLAFSQSRLYKAIVLGDLATVRLLIESSSAPHPLLETLNAACPEATSIIEVAAALGQPEIVNFLTSNDTWIASLIVHNNIKSALAKVDIILARMPKHQAFKACAERRERYQAIRSRLRATLMLPLESVRTYDENHIRKFCFNLPNELCYLIAFFLLDAGTYTNLLTKHT